MTKKDYSELHRLLALFEYETFQRLLNSTNSSNHFKKILDNTMKGVKLIRNGVITIEFKEES